MSGHDIFIAILVVILVVSTIGHIIEWCRENRADHEFAKKLREAQRHRGSR